MHTAVTRSAVVVLSALSVAVIAGGACTPGAYDPGVAADYYAPQPAVARLMVDLFARGSIERSSDRRKPYRLNLPLELTETAGVGGNVREVGVEMTFSDPREVVSLSLDASSIQDQAGTLRFAARGKTRLELHADFALSERPSTARFNGLEMRVHYTDDTGIATWVGRILDTNHPNPPGWPFEFSADL